MSDLFGNTIKSAKYIYDDEDKIKLCVELTLTSGTIQIVRVDNTNEHYRELMVMVDNSSLTIADKE